MLFATSKPAGTPERVVEVPENEPRTFLYTLRSAISDQKANLTQSFIHNGNRCILESQKFEDEEAALRFAALGLVPNHSRIVRLNGKIREPHGRTNSDFRLWFEPDAANLLPISFEFKPHSCLHLIFESEPPAPISAKRGNL